MINDSYEQWLKQWQIDNMDLTNKKSDDIALCNKLILHRIIGDTEPSVPVDMVVKAMRYRLGTIWLRFELDVVHERVPINPGLDLAHLPSMFLMNKPFKMEMWSFMTCLATYCIELDAESAPTYCSSELPRMQK